MSTTHHRGLWPQSVAEAVDQLLAEMPQAEREKLQGMPEDKLGRLHFGLGAAICNGYGLWQGNDALLADCAAARGRGGEHSWLHLDPDSASTVILEAAWRRLQEQK